MPNSRGIARLLLFTLCVNSGGGTDFITIGSTLEPGQVAQVATDAGDCEHAAKASSASGTVGNLVWPTKVQNFKWRDRRVPSPTLGSLAYHSRKRRAR